MPMRLLLSLFCAFLALSCAGPPGGKADREHPPNPRKSPTRDDYMDRGPLGLMITYKCEPGRRPLFRDYMRREGLALFERGKKEGWLESYQFFFNWYVDRTTFDAAVLMRFHRYEDVARWKEIEEANPGGLYANFPHARPLETQSVDFVWENHGAGDPDRRESVFLLIPYEYLGLVAEYKDYADCYVVPQLDGWIREGIMNSYRILLNRFPTGDRWQVMLVLEYKDLASFGRRKQVKWKVRRKLRQDPLWVYYAKIKRTIRQELEPVITSLLFPAGPQEQARSATRPTANR